MSLPFPSTKFTLRGSSGPRQFIRPADPDAVLDTIPDELYERDKFLPYWAELWPSAEVLCGFLDTLEVPGPCIACEIGAGLAVPSAVAAARGINMVAVDISHAACRFAAHNIRSYAGSTTQAQVVCADWRTTPFLGRFDVIFAADVLYEPRWVIPVAEFLQTHLKPTGNAYIADPGRPSWKNFRGELSTRGMPNQLALREQSSNEKSVIEILTVQPD